MPLCPLCDHVAAAYHEDRMRAYFQCAHCHLVFADPASRLGSADEKAHYDKHENDPADLGYRRFLNRLAAPLLGRLRVGMEGLDFGSGPGPTLSVMLEEAGVTMRVYDPFYAADPAALRRTYDFVTCTETVEHFHQPGRAFARLASLVRPGGYLGIMTKLVINRERFAAWHYKNDPTHVSFYAPATFAYLADRFGFTADRVDRDVYILQKHGGACAAANDQ